jgi:hypothetical protein
MRAVFAAADLFSLQITASRQVSLLLSFTLGDYAEFSHDGLHRGRRPGLFYFLVDSRASLDLNENSPRAILRLLAA